MKYIDAQRRYIPRFTIRQWARLVIYYSLLPIRICRRTRIRISFVSVSKPESDIDTDSDEPGPSREPE